jgi:hypothetical protein
MGGIAYCTNVHAGADLDATRANLAQHALAVKQLVNPDEPLGIGLWLSASAAARLRDPQCLADLATWMSDAELVPFTVNGFPYGDFHRPTVKHDVYHPTWAEAARVEYTLDLIAALNRLLHEGVEGSISTLPLCWGVPAPDRDMLVRCAANLRLIADHLARLEDEQGRLIYVCLEPEPGCVLQRSSDVVEFFHDYLSTGTDVDRIRRYVRVCHDICHASVMFEDQAAVVGRYREAGLRIGKIQVSSAIILPLDDLPPDEHVEALAQLRGFAEDRYLHQTTVRRGTEWQFFDDLPEAVKHAESRSDLSGEWRVHFHVPIFLERSGWLRTSREEILACLRAAQGCPELSHLEIETYAWSVLPETLRRPNLAEGIAEEIRWLRDMVLPHVASP